jgi:hypothetical protein
MEDTIAGNKDGVRKDLIMKDFTMLMILECMLKEGKVHSFMKEFYKEITDFTSEIITKDGFEKSLSKIL